MPATSAGMPCFFRAPICALRIVKALRIRRFSPGIVRPEQHEPGDQLCIDPVCPGAGAPGKRKGFYLRRGPLLRVDPRRDARSPEHPFLTTALRLIDPPERSLILTALKPNLDRTRHLPDRRPPCQQA